MNKVKTKVTVIRSTFNSDIVNNLYKGVEECFNKKNWINIFVINRASEGSQGSQGSQGRKSDIKRII